MVHQPLRARDLAAAANPKALEARSNSSRTIIYSIGSLYTSIIPQRHPPRGGRGHREPIRAPQDPDPQQQAGQGDRPWRLTR